MYLERLQSVKDEKLTELPAIKGVLKTPLMSLEKATQNLTVPESRISNCLTFARTKKPSFSESIKKLRLTLQEVGALHLYTLGGGFYSTLNAQLRNENRELVKPYFPYLRLFQSAFEKLMKGKDDTASILLYRGVSLDLRSRYPKVEFSCFPSLPLTYKL